MNALGGALLHFLWEGALIAFFVAVFCSVARTSRARYLASCVALYGMAGTFLATLMLLSASAAPGFSRPPAVLWPAPADSTGTLPVAGLFDANGLNTWLVALWVAGVVVFYSRSLSGWVLAQRYRRAGLHAAPPHWQNRLRELAVRMRITRPMLLLESSLVHGPTMIGFLRPVILMPLGVLSGYSTVQIECILVHELAHIRRSDYIVNLMQTLVEGLLFYHPAVWWVSRMVRTEREHCCDDAVVSLGFDASSYAATLASLEERRWNSEAVMAVSGGNLERRIRRLLGKPNNPVPGLGVALALLAVPVGLGLAAWQPAKPVSSPKEPLPNIQRRAETSPSQPTRILAQGKAKQRPASEPVRLQGTPYQRWLDEEAVYLITGEERAAFLQLPSDEERMHFIDQFWKRRDPSPGTEANEFREEHYRRIAYSNDRFAATGLAGWRTDRGRMYIAWGPPDEMEEHPDGENPREAWRYLYIEGMGRNVTLEFRPNEAGVYVLTGLQRNSTGSTR